jgi:hypothetical protein
MRLGLLGIFTWFPQVRHPALTWDWSAAGVAGAGWQYGAGGCGASMVEVSGAGAARLRFEVAAVAPAGYLTPALNSVGMAV